MRFIRFFVPFVFVLLIISDRCAKEEPEKFIRITATDPDGNLEEVAESLSVDIGKRITMKAQFPCPEDWCLWEWKLGDKIISRDERALLVICEATETNLEVLVMSINQQILAKKSVKIYIKESSAQRTEEAQNALSTLKKGNFDIGSDKAKTDEAISKLTQAGVVLQNYLDKENACDIEAAYGLSIIKMALALAELSELISRMVLITTDEVKDLVDGLLKPAIDALRTVATTEVPEDFSVRILRLRIKVMEDNPYTAAIKETLEVYLSGEHDSTDFFFILAMAEFLSMGFNTLFAYNGALDFILKLPEKIFETQKEEISVTRMLEELVVKELSENPAFLGLSADAIERLKIAQADLYMALLHLQEGMERLIRETDDQMDDIVRYWDCGEDLVCPASCEQDWGDPAEPYADVNGNGKYDEDPDGDGETDDREPFVDKNGNGKWDDAWHGRDKGECDNKFTIGEAIGTESLKTTRFDRIFVPFTKSYYNPVINNKLFQVLAQNVVGGVLEIHKIVGFASEDTLKNLVCSFGIPYPEIRMWEFFSSPTPLRDMIPLWNPTAREIIVQTDSEPFEDTGFDGKYSWEYEDFHPLMNPDPDIDDWDPNNNVTDGVDTDNDGRCADDELVDAYYRKKEGKEPQSDRDCMNFLGSPVDDEGEMQDMGNDGNMFFDFIDKNKNGKPDKGDITEPWDDYYGILNGRKGTLCKDVCENNQFDYADVEHIWPTGSRDPKNGVGAGGMMCKLGYYDGDENGELIDYIYFLWQDPTFSGILRLLPGIIRNSEGEALTLNATFNRMIWKAYEVAREQGFIK